jgi:hypothetical protein
MNCNNNIPITGRVMIRRFDKNHNLLNSVVQNNLVVNSGLSFFVNKILDLPGNEAVVDKIGIGNGDKIPELTDTELAPGPLQVGLGFTHETEYTFVRFKQAVEPNGFIVEAVFVENIYVNQDVVEVGLYTDAEDAYGVPTGMIARTVLQEANRFTKAATDYLSITWNITFG